MNKVTLNLKIEGIEKKISFGNEPIRYKIKLNGLGPGLCLFDVSEEEAKRMRIDEEYIVEIMPKPIKYVGELGIEK